MQRFNFSGIEFVKVTAFATNPLIKMKKLTCLLLPALAVAMVCSAQTGERVFSRFSAVVKESNKVALQWDIDSARDGDFFVAERSQDGNSYETIAAQAVSNSKGHYELMDQSPPNGNQYYRIRYTSHQGSDVYSKAIQLSISGEVDFKFYPNPVDKLFIVRTEHLIDLEILDAGGSVRLSKRLQPGIQVINASALEHGVYVLRVTDKESNRAISSQLVKN